MITVNKRSRKRCQFIWTLFCPVVLKIADVLLFLCINGDHRLTCLKVLFCQIVDDPKLLITVRARLAYLQHFLVHLLAVPHVCE